MRPVISLGDAVRALSELWPIDTEAGEVVAEMLGLRPETVKQVLPVIGLGESRAPEKRADEVPAATDRGTKPLSDEVGTQMATEEDGDEDVRIGLDSELSIVRDGAIGPVPAPEWLLGPGDSLDAPQTYYGEPPPAPPLFKPRQKRALLTAVLATPVPEGELDLPAIVEVAAQAKSLRSLPRLAIHTLRRGAQVILDGGPGMDPYRDDQRQLVGDLGRLIGHDRLEILRFVGCPNRGVGSGPRSDWRDWRPPLAGVPVLVVTDLGIGGGPLDDDRAEPYEWRRFASRVQAEGHSLLGLVPYEPPRWPPMLVRAMTLIHWSERTTAGDVQHALAEAGRRRG
jgi:hypothetical protein